VVPSQNSGVLIIGSGFAGVWAAAGWDPEVRLTGEAAKALKKAICEGYIYPPAHDGDALLAGAARRPHPAIFT
jgi:hypothetical protein